MNIEPVDDDSWFEWERSVMPTRLVQVSDLLWSQWAPELARMSDHDDVVPLAPLGEYPTLFRSSPSRLIDFSVTDAGRLVWLRLVRLAYLEGKFIDLAYDEDDSPWIVGVSLNSSFYFK